MEQSSPEISVHRHSEAVAETEPLVPVEELKVQIDLLVSDGDRLAKQLSEHGDHQSSMNHGHWRPDCYTCRCIDGHNETVKVVKEKLAELFPPTEE